MQVIVVFIYGVECCIVCWNVRKCYRFFWFNDMGTVLQDCCVVYVVFVIVIICRVGIVVGCDVRCFI